MVKISPMGRIFKFMVLRLLENVFVSRKNESFYSSSHAPEQTPSRFLLSHPQGERYYTFPPGSFFFENLDTFFPTKKAGREIYELKKSSKLICVGTGHKF